VGMLTGCKMKALVFPRWRWGSV